MSKSKKVKEKYSLKRFLIDALIVSVAFFAITWWQEKDLIPDDGSETIPTVTVHSIKGESYNLKSVLSDKQNNIIYFFAPWCSICKMSAPNLNSLSEDINIVAVALSYESKLDVSRFVRDADLKVPVYLGSEEVSSLFKIEAFPTYYVVDPTGKVVDRSTGYSTEIGLKWRTL